MSFEELRILFENGSYSEAISISDKNTYTTHSNPSECYIKAACFFKLGEFGDAFPLLEELEGSFNENPEYLSLFGACCRRLGFLDRALELLSRALEINPQDISIKNNFANLLIDTQQYQRAHEILFELTKNNPEYEDASVNFKRLLQYWDPSKLSDEASNSSNSHLGTTAFSSIPLFVDPLKLAFSDEEVQNHGRLNNPKSTKPQDLKNFVPQIDLSDETAGECLSLARKALDENNPEFALQLSTLAIRKSSTLFDAYDVASDSLIALKRFVEAEICLLHSLTLNGPKFKHYVNLFSLSLMRKDLVLCSKYYELASSLDSSNPNLNHLKKMLSKLHSTSSSQLFAFENSFSSLPEVNRVESN
ncbi:tetratricopeptide repeat protein [Synechococcus sp. YX-04-1]|uniref:tetratricopeptide repeat protein n=1 Tax=Synechococcus sp. YX-04-1 TaxID=3062778 RepID=UPI0026E45ECA|nr:tetratricopeptide repeat protein [Synechococcus sp. YX-04-1]MDO6351166.1 tetratricopeptide repeat protein [Synechococcus sp. YX-04-1]